MSWSIVKRSLIFAILFSIQLKSFSQPNHYSISSKHFYQIELTLKLLYNQEYDSAECIISQLEKNMTDYPGLHLLKAYACNIQYGPLNESNEHYAAFLRSVDSTMLLAGRWLQNNPESNEAMFFVLSIHAMLARLHVDSGHSWKAILQAKKAYRYVTKVMDRVDAFPEFNLYCGIYNYYREKYPEENAYVKPVLWFFKNGSKEEGLQMLKKGSAFGLFTKVECLTYLYHINFRYEFEPEGSIDYAYKLHQLYPNNRSFAALLVENLLFMGELCNSKVLIDSVLVSNNPYHQYIGHVYLAIHHELQGKTKESEAVYNAALKLAKEKEIATPHYQSMCYLGLGRIQLSTGMIDEAKSYLKLAEKTSEYGFIRDRAKEILNTL